MWAILAALVAFFVEASAYCVIRWVEVDALRASGGGTGIFIDSESPVTPNQIENYFGSRHPVLGWGPDPGHDECDARPNPAHPCPATACVATFGDSFTEGAEVDDEHAWSNQLSRRLGCRVANFGVGGYGTDQAYLRFRSTNVKSVSVVVLGLFPENIERNVNQYRGFLSGSHSLMFKPRFVLAEGELVLVPLIEQTGFDYAALLEHPEKFLAHEFFLPESRWGPVRVGSPWSWSATQALLHPRAWSVLAGLPNWAPLYSSEDLSGGVAVTKAILRSFAQEVRSIGKNPLVYVFTDVRSVRTFSKTERWTYQPILDSLVEERIPHLHLGDLLPDYIDLGDICSLFTTRSALGCSGHYTELGNQIVAESLYEYISENAWMKPRQAGHLLDNRGVPATATSFLENDGHPSPEARRPPDRVPEVRAARVP